MENLIIVSKEKWDSIPSDYKGKWIDYNNEHPELLGKRTVLSGCISKKIGTLLIESVHFVIK
ncbi:hypothetical protein [Thomasclavelia cocleata]|uniref:hypothetical protein n=1 Tax=Thomasclavelia cocleata TaxID=69824 RepID=UPI0024958E97|nr:hypothetical protein [Thomasclavelia cocleata]